MTQDDFHATLASTMHVPKAEAKRRLEAMLTAINAALLLGHSVPLQGVGTLELVTRPKREGRNPATGEHIWIESRKAIVLRPSASSKRAANL